MRWFSILSLILILSVVSCSKKNSKAFNFEKSTPEELLVYADNAFTNSDFESAFQAYGVIYNQYPTSREYIDAAIGMSKCYEEFQDYVKAFDLLYNLLRENLIPSKVPEIYNVIAEFYERSAGISEQLKGEGSADYKTAIEYYKKAIDYPNSEDQNAKAYAQYMMGTLYEKLNEYDQALEAFQKTSTEYPSQQWASLAQEQTDIIQSKIASQKMKGGTGSDTLASSLKEPLPEKKEQADTLKKAAKVDTLKTIQKPDTTQTLQPEEAPPDTTTEQKPKLDLN